MTDSAPIPPRKDGAREDRYHHHHHHVPSSLTNSFMSRSPFANEILASDIADCSEDDAVDHLQHDAESLFSDADSQAAGPILYKQPQGVAYGVRRPSILPERGGAEAILNPIERLQSLDAERSLLRRSTGVSTCTDKGASLGSSPASTGDSSAPKSATVARRRTESRHLRSTLPGPPRRHHCWIPFPPLPPLAPTGARKI